MRVFLKKKANTLYLIQEGSAVLAEMALPREDGIRAARERIATYIMEQKDFAAEEFSTPVLIKGGEYWDSQAKTLQKGDLIIENGVISR
ncbi:MAG: hypothetical protein ACFFED_11435, partial [Candidatus Thorarchaeota archaeon]